MSTKDTRDNLTTARSTEADPTPPPPRTLQWGEVMMRPGSVDPYQDPATYIARTGGLEGILEWHVRHSGRGHKGRCDTPAITSGIPRVPGVLGHAASRGCDVLWLDYDGIRAEDIPRIKAFLEREGWEYVYVTTSSYDAQNGLYKVRFFLRWSRRASVKEHSTAVLELMMQVAEDLGHEVPSAGGRKQQKEWLSSIAHDPQSTVAATPASVRRWGSARIAAQADEAHTPGEPVDLDRLIAAARGRRRASKAIARRATRGVLLPSSGTPPPSSGSPPHYIYDQRAAAAPGGGVDAANAALDGIGALHPGCGNSDTGLWDAAWACMVAGLSADDAAELLLSRYVPQGQPASRVLHKARDAARYASRARSPGALHVARDGATLRLAAGVHIERMKRRYMRPLAFAAEHHRGEVLLTKAECGTGKTYRLRGTIATILERGGRVVVVVHRRALARALAAELGLPCYLDIRGRITGSCVIVLDSIARLETLAENDDGEPCDLSIDLLIVDESEQVARHLFGGTILAKGRVLQVWAAFREVARVALSGLYQDADLGALSQGLVSLLHPKLTPWIQANTYHRPIRALFLEGSEGLGYYWGNVKETLKHRLSNRQYLTPSGNWRPPDALYCSVPAYPLHIFCTSKSMATGHAKALRKEFPDARILVIDSDRTGLDDASAALSDTRLWGEYDVIITTTAAGSGVSVPVHCWVYLYCEAGDGPIAPDIYQGASRSRPAASWTIYMEGTAPYRETDPKAIEETLHRRCKESIDLLRGIGGWAVNDDGSLSHGDPDLVHLYATVLGYERMQAHLCDRITDEGKRVHGALVRHFSAHGVECRIGDPRHKDGPEAGEKAAAEIRKLLMEGRTEAKDERIALIVDAPENVDDASMDLYRKVAATPEGNAAIEKAEIREFYGPHVQIDADLLKRDAGGRRRGHLQAFAELELWIEDQREAVADRDTADLLRGGALIIRHRCQRGRVRAAIFGAFGWSDLDTGCETPARIPAPVVMAKIYALCKSVLDLSLEDGTMAPMQVLYTLLQGIGVRRRIVKTKVGGKDVRRYYVDAESLALARHESAAYRARLTGEEVADVVTPEIWTMDVEDMIASLEAA